jgi:rhodanese-related sulfurtransferase
MHPFLLLSKDPSKYILVDVRTDEERSVSTIPGSISRSEFETDYSSKYASQSVICFDTVGYLSAAYVAAMNRKGMTNGKFLGDGGFLGYCIRDYPIVTPSGSRCYIQTIRLQINAIC